MQLNFKFYARESSHQKAECYHVDEIDDRLRRQF